MNNQSPEYFSAQKQVRRLIERLSMALDDENARHKINIPRVLRGVQVMCELRDMIRDDAPGDDGLCDYVVNRYIPAVSELNKYTPKEYAAA